VPGVGSRSTIASVYRPHHHGQIVSSARELAPFPQRQEQVPKSRAAAILVLLSVTALAACSPAPSPPHDTEAPTSLASSTPSAQSEPNKTASATPTTDATPSASVSLAWEEWQPLVVIAGTAGAMSYLTTVPLDPACAAPMSASSGTPASAGRQCRRPLASLPEHSVLVTRYTTRLLWPIPSAGAPFVVAGLPSRLQVEAPGTCADLHADETMDSWQQSGGKGLSNIVLEACLKGPDLPELEAAARAMLAKGA
jgi:hypothetical protein